MMNKEEAIKQIPIIQAELDRLKSIVEAPEKISKEERFYEMVKELTQKIDQEKYPNSIFYFKGDDLLFEIKNDYIYCSYKYVWSVFEKEYSMLYSDIQSFIAVQVQEHFKRKGLTPVFVVFSVNIRVQEHFKRKGLTPIL